MARKRPPADKLDATLVVWGKGRALHRVHRSVYQPDQFNPALVGDARFSPLLNSGGEVIPTLYAGSTFDCVLMETVFHDVPYVAGLKTLSKSAYVLGMVRSKLRLARQIHLVDLSSIALHKLGVSRASLIDTNASEYSRTREWALALHDQNPQAEGMTWTSRRDDHAQAIVLFGDRLDAAALTVEEASAPLMLQDGSACADVIALAAQLGVLLVD